jgi:hypothetical protein
VPDEQPSYRPLLNAAERQADVADDLGRTFAVELSRVQIDLDREIRRLLLRASEGNRTAVALAARGLALRRELRELLTRAGYDDLAGTATLGALERMAEVVTATRLAAQVERFATFDSVAVQALKELARLDIVQQGDEVAIALWRSLVQGQFSGRPQNAILDDLANALDDELSQVRTLYDTMTSTFGRQVEALKSTGEPDELFAYLGPVDSKMRPFCKERIGRIYTRAEIDAMDNGQLPNVFMTAGGYNCRHSFTAVSQFSELVELQGTDERIPEIAETLKRVQPVAKAKAA